MRRTLISEPRRKSMNSSKVRTLVVACCALLLMACAAQRHRDAVQSGLLIQGTPQKTFLEIWGSPQRTRTVISDTEEKRLEFSRFGGFYGRENVTYGMSGHTKRDGTPTFTDHELIRWRSEKNTRRR